MNNEHKIEYHMTPQTHHLGRTRVVVNDEAPAVYSAADVVRLPDNTFEIRLRRNETRTFEIWSEGYLCTGMEGIPARAQLHGKAEGSTFDEAVEKFVASRPEKVRSYWSRSPDGRWSMWGCRVYDNEKEARETFG
jgi:hypothetical protein